MSEKTTLFDFLNDVSHVKKNILTEENESDLSIYMLNRFLSMDITTVMYANEMNQFSHLPKRMQYDYYLHAIKKQKRYFKYIKYKNQDDVDVIREYYNYNEQRAKEILPIFSKDDLDEMRAKLNKGGTKDAKAKRK